MIVIISMLTILVSLMVGFVLYVNINYSHIRSDIQIIGVIYDRVVQFNDEESLRKLSKKMKSSAMKAVSRKF